MTSSESAAGRRRKAADDANASPGRLEDDVLTTAQVAQLLHVIPRTVIRFAKEGKLPAHRLPGTRQFLFWRNDVVRLIEESVVDPADFSAGDAEQTVSADE